MADGVATEKERCAQGAAIWARRLARRIASQPAGPHSEWREQGEKARRQTPGRGRRWRSSAGAEAACEPRWLQTALETDKSRPPVLLGRGAGLVGRDRGRRRCGLGRRTF